MTSKKSSEYLPNTFANSDIAYVKYNSTSRLNAYDADISTTFEEIGTPRYTKFSKSNKAIGFGRVGKSDYDSNGVLTPTVNAIKNNLDDLSTILTGKYERSHHKGRAWTWKLRNEYATQTVKDMVASIEVALQDKKTPAHSRLTTADAAALLDIAKTKLDIRFKTDKRVRDLGYQNKYMQEAYALLDSKIRSYNYYANKGIDYISSSELKARTSAERTKSYAKKVGTLESKIRSNGAKHAAKIRAEKTAFEKRYQELVKKYAGKEKTLKEEAESQKNRADSNLEALVTEQGISKEARRQNEALHGEISTLKQQAVRSEKSRRRHNLATGLLGLGLIVGAYLLGARDCKTMHENDSLPVITVVNQSTSNYDSTTQPIIFKIPESTPLSVYDTPATQVEESVEDPLMNDPRYNVEATEEVVAPNNSFSLKSISEKLHTSSDTNILGVNKKTPTVSVPEYVNSDAAAESYVAPQRESLNFSSSKNREKFYTLEQRLNGSTLAGGSTLSAAGTPHYVSERLPLSDLVSYNFDTAMTNHQNDKFDEKESAQNMKQLAIELRKYRNEIPHSYNGAFREMNKDLVGQGKLTEDGEGLTEDDLKLLEDFAAINSGSRRARLLGGVPLVEKLTSWVPLPWKTFKRGVTINGVDAQ